MLSRESHSYDILGEIGRGGMASVAVARFKGGPGVFIPVVIKRILPELENTDDSRAMFLEEARTLSLIHHPNVVRVLETGTDMLEQPYIVFEYLHGEPLDELLKAIRSRGERLPLKIGLHIIAEVLAGLHAAHEAKSMTGAQTNLVHRDVSPQNIFVGFDGWVRVIDFGIARTDERTTHTQEGILKGKIRYMSPEQCRQRPLTRTSDIFSVGVVMFELLTDSHPFDAESDFETMQKICTEVAPDPSETCPDVPNRVAEICLTALEPDPQARFASALEMRREIMEAISRLTSDYSTQSTEVLSSYTRAALPEQYIHKEHLLSAIRNGSSVSVGRAVAPENRTMTVRTHAHAPRARMRPVIIGLLLAALVALGVGVAAQQRLFEKPHTDNATATPSSVNTSLASAPFAATRPKVTAHDAGVSRDARQGGEQAARDVTLTVGSQPASARVYLDNRLLGTTPLREGVEKDMSRHVVRFEAEGYEAFTQEVSLNQNVALHVSLRKSAKSVRNRLRRNKKPRQAKPGQDNPVWPVFQ